MNKLKIKTFNIDKINEYFEILKYLDLTTVDFNNNNKENDELIIKNMKNKIQIYINKNGIFNEKKKMISKLKEINERLNKYGVAQKRKKKNDLNEKMLLENKLKEKIKKENDIIDSKLQYLIILNKILILLKKYSSINKDYNCEIIINKLNNLKQNNKSLQFYYFYLRIIKYIIKNYHNSNATLYYKDIIFILFDKNYNYIKQKSSILILLLESKEKKYFYNIPILIVQQIIEYFILVILLDNGFNNFHLNILKDTIINYTLYYNYLENNPFIFEFLFDFFQILILKFILNINKENIESIKICYEIIFIIIEKNIIKKISKLKFGKLILIGIYSNEIIKKRNNNNNDFLAKFGLEKKYMFETLMDLLTRDENGFYQKVINDLGLGIKENYNNNKFKIFLNFNEKLCKDCIKYINNFLEFDENNINFIQKTFESKQRNIFEFLINKIIELIENDENELINLFNLNIFLIKILDIVKKTGMDITNLMLIILNKKGELLKFEWDYIFQIFEILKDKSSFSKHKSKIFNTILDIYLNNSNNFYLNFYENCSKFIDYDDKLMNSNFEILKVKILTNNYEIFSKNIQNLFEFYEDELIKDINNKIYYEDSFIYLMQILYLYLKKNINFENISNFIQYVLIKNYNKLLNINCYFGKTIINFFNYYLVKILLVVFNKNIHDLNLFNYIINIINENDKEKENKNLIFLKINFYEILYEKFIETNNYLIIKLFSDNFKIFLQKNINNKEIEIFDNILNLIKNKFFVDHNYKIYANKYLFNNQSPNIFFKFVSKQNDNNEIIFFENELLLTYIITIMNKNIGIEKIIDAFEKKFEYLYFFKGLDFSELIKNILKYYEKNKISNEILEKIISILSNIAFHILLYQNQPNYIVFSELCDINLENFIIQKLFFLFLQSIDNKDKICINKTLKIIELYFYSLTNSQKRKDFNNSFNIHDIYNPSERKSLKFVYDNDIEKNRNSLNQILNENEKDFLTKCNNIMENICKIFSFIPLNINICFSILKFFYINRENFCQDYNQKNIVLIIYITINFYYINDENINFDLFKINFSDIDFPKIQKVKNFQNEIYKIIKEFSSIILLNYIDKSNYINDIYQIMNLFFKEPNSLFLSDLIKWKLLSKIERDNRSLNLFKNDNKKNAYDIDKNSKFYKNNNILYEIKINDNNENIINIRSNIYNINMKITKDNNNHEKIILKSPLNKKKILYYIFLKELNNNPNININDIIEKENNNNITNDDLNETKEIFSFFYSFIFTQNTLNSVKITTELGKYIHQLDYEYPIFFQFNCDITYVSNEAIENKCILNPLKSYEIKNKKFVSFLHSLGNIIKNKNDNNLLFFHNDNLFQINFYVKNFKSGCNRNDINDKIHILFIENIYKKIDIYNLNQNIVIYILIIPSINSHYLIKFVVNKNFKNLNKNFIKDFENLFLKSTNIYINDNFEILSDFIIKHIILLHYFIYFQIPDLYKNNNIETRYKIINEIKINKSNQNV